MLRGTIVAAAFGFLRRRWLRESHALAFVPSIVLFFFVHGRQQPRCLRRLRQQTHAGTSGLDDSLGFH